LATSSSELTGAEVVKLYGKRFTIEETFRETKDQRFGLGCAFRRSWSAVPSIVVRAEPVMLG
jgi:hypothetical protein